MQEEVTQKTVTFCIRATKITADLLKKVLVAYLRHQNLYAIKEKCQHGSIQVPYSYYDCGILDYFTSVPLHWHSEMELNYIKSGRRRVLVPVSQEPPGYHELETMRKFL